jgi:hypothetical protein
LNFGLQLIRRCICGRVGRHKNFQDERGMT